MAAVFNLNTLVQVADPPAEPQPDAPLDTLMMTTVMRRAVQKIILEQPRTDTPRPFLTRAEREAITWEDAEWR